MSLTATQPFCQLKTYNASNQGIPQVIRSLRTENHQDDEICSILHIQKGNIKIRIHKESIILTEGDSVALPPSFEILSCSPYASWTRWDLMKKLVHDTLLKYRLCPLEGKTPLEKAVCKLNSDPLFHYLIPSVIDCFELQFLICESLLFLKAEEFLLTLFNKPAYHSFCRTLCKDIPESTELVYIILSEEFTENRSLEAWANRCHMSTSTFKRRCKEILGTTPVRWLQQRRLEYAAQLLQTSSLQINEIAYTSGFENASHFTQLFKLRYRCTPAQYRENKSAITTGIDLEKT